VAITDWLDGYLARKLQQMSSFGAFLDPVADKLIVTATLLILLNLERISLIIALVIIGRELAISALREWMALIGRSKNVAVHSLGKLKTIAQMIAIPMLLFYQDLYLGTYNGITVYLPIAEMGRYFLYLATILTIWSMVYYLKQAYPLIKDQIK
jgi:CDP-diacylglycerol--glycerol-3-phosphate 3-phosphatidyltransferase